MEWFIKKGEDRKDKEGGGREEKWKKGGKS
jgi:hypothetical protein